MCDHGSMVIRATRLVAGAGDIAQKVACASLVRSSLQPVPAPLAKSSTLGALSTSSAIASNFTPSRKSD
jgi:hypothetical protein